MTDFLTALKTATNIYSDIELKKEKKEALEYVNISACSLTMDGSFFNIVSREGDKCIKPVNLDHFNIADFTLVYVHPETVTTNSKLTRMLLTQKIQQVCCVVIDEVHMVSEW